MNKCPQKCVNFDIDLGNAVNITKQISNYIISSQNFVVSIAHSKSSIHEYLYLTHTLCMQACMLPTMIRTHKILNFFLLAHRKLYKEKHFGHAFS